MIVLDLISLDPISLVMGSSSLWIINHVGLSLGLSLLPVVVTILIVTVVLSSVLTILMALTTLAVLGRMGAVEEAVGMLLEPIVPVLDPNRS